MSSANRPRAKRVSERGPAGPPSGTGANGQSGLMLAAAVAAACAADDAFKVGVFADLGRCFQDLGVCDVSHLGQAP